jgi:glycosyltransferase involved in cell wall biosynthesis
MKIDILCGNGSQAGVTLDDIYGTPKRIGVGGSELALLTLCEAWGKEHEVTLYNNPHTITLNKSFRQAHITNFNPADARDALIAFRQPTHLINGARGKKIFWSCDQYTVGDFAAFSRACDVTVVISPRHAEHFKNVYGIDWSVVIDLPVRTWEYERDDIKKVPRRIIFSSVPERGLWQLLECYPIIKSEVQEASLVITSDYRLWGASNPLNSQFIARAMTMNGAKFLGAVPRKKLIEEQLAADIHLYPCIYDELFCISVAESQVAGCLPITSSYGALTTTNMGIVLEGAMQGFNWAKMRERFIETTITYLKDRELLAKKQAEVRQKAIERFSLERILPQWEEVFR